jgi:glycosyltransferase involved in cell wall biosynthesis
MRKVLIFSDSYLPGYKGGGPIVSVSNLVDVIEDDVEVLVCTRNHDFGDEEPYHGIVSNKEIISKNHRILYLSSFNFHSIAKTIQTFKPDAIYLNSFFSTTTQIVLTLNTLFFKSIFIVAPRGELLKNPLLIKPAKKAVYIFIYKLLGFHKKVFFHSTGDIETKSIESIFGVDKISINEIPNLVKKYDFQPIIKERGELKLVFISRISFKKNLHYVLTVLSKVKESVSLDIYGPIEDLRYWQQCKQIIQELPSNISVNYGGGLSGHDVVSKMRCCHVFFFPTLSENYGHVIVEAMQAGLVPILSDQTPWDKLSENNAGWDINLNNVDEYVSTIENLFHMDRLIFSELSSGAMRYIKTRINLKDMSKKYINFFSKVG